MIARQLFDGSRGSAIYVALFDKQVMIRARCDLREVRDNKDLVMLRDAALMELWPDVLALAAFTVLMMAAAVLRFRKQLD